MSQDSRALLRLVCQLVGHHRPRYVFFGMLLVVMISWLGDGLLELARAAIGPWIGQQAISGLIACFSLAVLAMLYAGARGALSRSNLGPVSAAERDLHGVRGVVAALSNHKEPGEGTAGLRLQQLIGWLDSGRDPDELLRELDALNHPWAMPIHLLRGLPQLESALFVLSREVVHQWSIFPRVVRWCLGRGPELELRAHTELWAGQSHEGLDVGRDFSGLLAAFDACVRELARAGLHDSQVAIDITSGTKLCSAAASMVALDQDRRMLYRRMNKIESSLTSFDVRYENIDSDSGSFA